MIEDIKLIKFLVLHDKQYQKLISKVGAILIALVSATWKFDFAQLTSKGIMNPATKLEIRVLLSVLLYSLFLLSFALLTRPYFKKWKNVPRLSSENLAKLSKYYGT
jgi:hypothetical protein